MSRESKQRNIILQQLQKNPVHPTANTLIDIIKKEYPKIGEATVYRNLNYLAEAGIIKKIEGLDNSAHYDHNTYNHYHFMCNKCKKIFDISDEIAPDIISNIEEQTGFTITEHNISFQGLCSDCKEKEKTYD